MSYDDAVAKAKALKGQIDYEPAFVKVELGVADGTNAYVIHVTGNYSPHDMARIKKLVSGIDVTVSLPDQYASY